MAWVAADHFTLSVDGDELWAVVQPVAKPGANQNQNMMNQQQGRPGGELQVVRRDPANGKELFRTSEIEELKQFQLLGTPLPAGGMLYLTACKMNQPSELHVLAVQSSTGRVQWITHVGTYQFNPLETRLATRSSRRMLLSGTRLYVDAHAGGLVELAANSGAIRWAYNYPAKMPLQQQRSFVWGWDDDEAGCDVRAQWPVGRRRPAVHQGNAIAAAVCAAARRIGARLETVGSARMRCWPASTTSRFIWPAKSCWPST